MIGGVEPDPNGDASSARGLANRTAEAPSTADRSAAPGLCICKYGIRPLQQRLPRVPQAFRASMEGGYQYGAAAHRGPPPYITNDEGEGERFAGERLEEVTTQDRV